MKTTPRNFTPASSGLRFLRLLVALFLFTFAGGAGAAIVPLTGPTTTATVMVNVIVDNAPGQNISKVTLNGNGTVSVDFSGIPFTTYGLQYTPTLAPAAWVTLGPPPGGTTSGFYRLIYPAPVGGGQ